MARVLCALIDVPLWFRVKPRVAGGLMGQSEAAAWHGNPYPRDIDAAPLQGQSSERSLTAYRRCLAGRGRPARRGLSHTGALFCRMTRVRFVAQFIANGS